METITSKKNEEFKERREYLAKALNSAKLDYYSKYVGNSLTILGPLINSLATATAAQAIRNGSSSLLLSLKMALQGIESEKCSAGVIGRVLSSSIDKITDLIIGTYLTKEDIGSKELFKLTLQALVLATISISWKFEQIDLINNTELKLDENENDRMKTFGFELILLLTLNTGIIQIVIKNIAAACGASELGQESIAKLIKGLVLILAILTGANRKQITLKMLVLDLKDYLIEGLEDIQTFVNKAGEADQISGQVTAISIFIQQAIASLQEEDFETLQQAYYGALDIVQANSKLMEEDIEQVTEFAAIISNAIARGSLEFSRTTTASLMI